MDSTANSTSKKQPLASPTAAVRVASELTTSTPLEHVQSVNVPYAAALTTPNATMRIQSTLPPIAMAQPLNIINQTQSHLHGGSNIPANPNGSKGVFSGEVNSADLNHPNADGWQLTIACGHASFQVALLGMSSYVGNASGSNGASSDEREYVESTYYSNNVNLCIGMLMAINLFMHVRCLRTAQLLTAELLAAGVDRQPAPALVLAASNPISTV
ncbi:unnamed protein product [Peronospora belbahrii]|uniref:Uncharacterized protein n=1 Tax=Peronospora belbahrii TaxID=622444 RepID=A0ABN8D533_9STRA|nr:unnamed protein product [Peronospora belbahrii]